jgi:hypothetical protein
VKPSPVSTGQAIGGIFWRQDGREMFFLNSPQQAVMAVAMTSPELQLGRPRLLFEVPSPTLGPAWLSTGNDLQSDAPSAQAGPADLGLR